MPVLKATVDSALKARFQAKATAARRSESELLRLAILAAVGDGDQAEVEVKPDDNRIDTVRMTVRMPRFLMEAVGARALARGMAPSRWVSALVQSNLSGQPVLTDAELEVVGATNRELAALGRNLNQIAKALNEAPHQIERLRLEVLTGLQQAVGQSRAALRDLVRASQNSWEADGTD